VFWLSYLYQKTVAIPPSLKATQTNWPLGRGFAGTAEYFSYSVSANYIVFNEVTLLAKPTFQLQLG